MARGLPAEPSERLKLQRKKIRRGGEEKQKHKMTRGEAQREEKVGARLSGEIHDGCFLLESNKGAAAERLTVDSRDGW